MYRPNGTNEMLWVFPRCHPLVFNRNQIRWIPYAQRSLQLGYSGVDFSSHENDIALPEEVMSLAVPPYASMLLDEAARSSNAALEFVKNKNIALLGTS